MTYEVEGDALPTVTWMLRAAVVFILFGAGLEKLTDAPAMALLFQQIALGTWFQYFTGTTEIVAAVLLALPATRFWGAAIAAGTMIGATATNLITPGIEQAAAKAALSLALFAAAAFVAWRLRPAVLRSTGKA